MSIQHLKALIAIPLISAVLITQDVGASASKQSLANYIESEINLLDDAVQSAPTEKAVIDGEKEEGFFFRRFWFRLRARVERDVPGLAGFAVIPEVELLWEHPYPDGWESYKIEKHKSSL